MKLAKRLAALVAATLMVLSLVACGGESYPLEYEYTVEWSQGVRGEKATLTLEEDGTFTYTYWASDSQDADRTVMNIEATGTYTKDGDTVEVTLEDVQGYAMNGDSKVDMSSETGYSLTYSQGSTTFKVDGGTFEPVE